jgi:uncharacterized protein HemX
MNRRTLSIAASVLLAAVLSFGGTSAFAGPDFFQQQMNQQLVKSKQQLQAAQNAKAAERDRLMAEHMHTMHDVMQQMKDMKPKAGMSMEEHQAWIEEHLKLMDLMVSQMMEEHHILMSGADAHQH